MESDADSSCPGYHLSYFNNCMERQACAEKAAGLPFFLISEVSD